MNRRGFLALIAPAAALLVAPELLIPKRTFFLPPAGGWGGNITATEVMERQREFMRRAVERVVDQHVLEAFNETWNNVITYGTGALKLEPGAVHYAPFKFIPLDPVDLTRSIAHDSSTHR